MGGRSRCDWPQPLGLQVPGLKSRGGAWQRGQMQLQRSAEWGQCRTRAGVLEEAPRPRGHFGAVLGPSAVTQGVPRLETVFPFAVGAAEPVSSPLLRQREPDGFAKGKRGWGSHDRWIAVKTLIAAFWGRIRFPFLPAASQHRKIPLLLHSSDAVPV